MTTTRLHKGTLLTQVFYSNAVEVVKQGLYVFNTFWHKAIPAKQRIREIEEGVKREFIGTIQDPNEAQRLISDIIKSASEEIQIIFPTSNTLYRYEHEVMLLKLLREKILIPSRKNNNKIKIRILVHETNSLNKEKMQKLLLVKGEGRGLKKEKIKEENSNFNIRYLNRSHLGNYKLTTLIIDNEFVITVELKDYTNVTKDQAIGLTTYSNSEATVLSYASIFETLWTQMELNE